jgi:hypothetical protein
MTRTHTADALARLAEVHPHHVERIRDAIARARVGTVAVFMDGHAEGAREFYTGIKPGDRVVVTSRYGTGSISVQSIEHRGAHLSVYSGNDLRVLDPAEWSYDDAVAARESAEKAAAESLAVARDRRANGNDDAALKALDDSQESYLLAFAVGIFGEYILAERLGRRY